MSAFTRFLRATPAARRPYSSFFSKPGGGRYFNNSHAGSKPAAAKPVAGKTKDPAAAAAAPVEDSSPAPTPANASPSPNTNPNANANVTPSVNSTSASPLDADPQPPLVSLSVPHPHPHPSPDPEAFKLHQFFSLHRPLLLLHDPAAILASPPPNVPLFPQAAPASATTEQWSWSWDDGSGVTALPHEMGAAGGMTKHQQMESDAEAARQLTRALTMARAGATVAWDETLRRLGMDVDGAAQDLRAAEWNQEWEDILADSVKRKRKKKMKKHKLRKLRKLTRAARLKQK
ncbi:hypothetical protein C8R45DRAFT_1209903 [Mycena sanguinolenta]|nr:hypothetical protein C8R45DRAFT_1209903 [Mycena sanguinolenta]